MIEINSIELAMLIFFVIAGVLGLSLSFVGFKLIRFLRKRLKSPVRPLQPVVPARA